MVPPNAYDFYITIKSKINPMHIIRDKVKNKQKCLFLYNHSKNIYI